MKCLSPCGYCDRPPVATGGCLTQRWQVDSQTLSAENKSPVLGWRKPTPKLAKPMIKKLC
ncbi:MAG: hypothetical protein ACTS3T_20430 [Almyronema sp.]